MICRNRYKVEVKIPRCGIGTPVGSVVAPDLHYTAALEAVR